MPVSSFYSFGKGFPFILLITRSDIEQTFEVVFFLYLTCMQVCTIALAHIFQRQNALKQQSVSDILHFRWPKYYEMKAL